jgi:macrolide transport system ATP-binding/permease protein
VSTQLTLHDVRKSFGERLLLDNVSLAVRPGERIGIVGENGAGKSTLLRLFAGRERPDDGEITVAATSVGYLGQTPELPPSRTVGDMVDAALADFRAMERRLRDLEARLDDPAALAEYGDLLTEFELRDGYQADARVDKAMHALGLAAICRDRRLGSLSGGEQARLGLACLLAAAPEVMLLDEPTNHLDAGALTWLEDHLRAHRGTVVAVSHDRVFLERVATAIVEVDADRRATARYGDGYAGYLAEKAAARRRWEQAYEQWSAEIGRLTEFAATTAHRVAPGREMKDRNKLAYDRDRGRVQSSVSSRVRNAQERLRRLRAEPVPHPPAPLRFTGRLATVVGSGTASRGSFAAGSSRDRLRDGAGSFVAESSGGRSGVDRLTGGGGSSAAEASDGRLRPDPSADAEAAPAADSSGDWPGGDPLTGEGSLAAGSAAVEVRDVRVADRLRVDSLTVGGRQRLLVHGPNGAGKTTLLRVLAGALEPDTGSVRRRGRIGYLAQEISAHHPQRTLLAAFAAGRPGLPEEHASRLLSLGLFRPADLHVPEGALSAGQRRRLSLARLVTGQVDLLLLDEPSNHLSLTLVEELEEAIDEFAGALVVVSHDRALRRRFAGTQLELAGGRLVY